MGYSNGSDDAQRTINRKMEKIGEIDTGLSIERNIAEGSVSTTMETSIEDEDFDTETEYQALDILYNTLRNSPNGQSRLDGLRTFPERPDDIGKQSWERYWIDEYEAAGLISGEELTERGRRFADEGLEWWVRKSSDINGLDEFYDLITTSGNQPEGAKIEAWKLYGNGEDSHTEVYNRTGLNPNTSRTFSDKLQDKGLIDEEYNFTEPGKHLNQVVDEHLEYLERQILTFDLLPERGTNSQVDELLRDAYQDQE